MRLVGTLRFAHPTKILRFAAGFEAASYVRHAFSAVSTGGADHRCGARPGHFYVAARTLSGGRSAGIASTFGAACGGLVHVIAGGLGVSALILASAQAFTALKLIGAIYLVWLGIKAFRDAGQQLTAPIKPAGAWRTFRDGVIVEALNPKTAAFFLAFIPQFIDPAWSHPALQFITLGLISVTLNSMADLVVVAMAATARITLARRPHWIRRLRQGSGLFMAGLGVSLALARRPVAS
jgi:threonine/homoserine/homoserine lactone efflux protein